MTSTAATSTDEVLDLSPYDAVLLLSFGGPERPEDVLPFLRNVTAGRGIPDQRLLEVGEHYTLFGGRSPINDQNRALQAALRAELDRRGSDTALLWGNRNWEPYLVDALSELAANGARRVLTVTTSAYSSYSSCRQYRENLADADAALRERGVDLVIDKVRPYAHHPGFSRTMQRLVTTAVRTVLPADQAPHLLFVTHSIPTAMDDTSGPGDGEGNLYSSQHAALARAITAEVNAACGTDLDSDLVYCSRSGPPQQPWTEPDINDALRELARDGVRSVVVTPIGFISDHMEVLYDLDTEAAATAAELGVRMVRVPTCGVDTEFVQGLVDLLDERARQARGESPTLPAWPTTADVRPPVCAAGCCPNLRQDRPALCGQD